MVRRIALGIVIACVAFRVAHADKPRLLVLPLTAPNVDRDVARAFDARLLVALEDTGRVTTVTLSDEPECATHACIVRFGADAGAPFVLVASVVREGATLTLFAALVDSRTGATARRAEIANLSSEALGKTAPIDVARQIVPAVPLASRPAAGVVGVLRPASGIGRAAAEGVASRLAALRTFGVTTLDAGSDRVAITHRAEVAIDQLAIAERRHHVRRYLDGTLVATLAITDLADRRVVFTRTVKVTVSRRARYSSTPEVAALLVDAAVAEWMTAFRNAGVEPRLRGGTR